MANTNLRMAPSFFRSRVNGAKGVSSRGFTFVEILAAMLFMAIVLPVAIEGLLLANTAQQRATRKREAAELAARILQEAMVTESWRLGDAAGDFDEDQPGFSWSLASTAWPLDTMRVVSVSVTYRVQDREFVETLSTLAPEEPAKDEGGAS